MYINFADDLSIESLPDNKLLMRLDVNNANRDDVFELMLRTIDAGEIADAAKYLSDVRIDATLCISGMTWADGDLDFFCRVLAEKATVNAGRALGYCSLVAFDDILQILLDRGEDINDLVHDAELTRWDEEGMLRRAYCLLDNGADADYVFYECKNLRVKRAIAGAALVHGATFDIVIEYIENPTKLIHDIGIRTLIDSGTRPISILCCFVDNNHGNQICSDDMICLLDNGLKPQEMVEVMTEMSSQSGVTWLIENLELLRKYGSTLNLQGFAEDLKATKAHLLLSNYQDFVDRGITINAKKIAKGLSRRNFSCWGGHNGWKRMLEHYHINY